MDASQIVAGKVYEDRDGLDRYVVSIEPAKGRKKARVTWRRPGSFATFSFTETASKFLGEVRRQVDRGADEAHALPNNGMALQPTGHKGMSHD